MEKINGLPKSKVLKKLENDNDYYGEFGKNFLSNSNIYDLLSNPASYLEETKETVAFKYGKAFHELMMFGKTSHDAFVDASTRSTKIYKEALLNSNEEILLLKKEYDDLTSLVEIGKNHKIIKPILEHENVSFEVPNVSMLTDNKLFWKCKADIVTDYAIYDLKTTQNIKSFARSSQTYNYDAQAYIYSTMFQKEIVFLVFEKGTGMVGRFDVTQEAYERGKNKVEDAEQVYLDYFVNKTKNIEDHFIYGEI